MQKGDPFEAISPCPGVYLIRNRISGKVYVGSGHNVRKRLTNHRSYLRRDIHKNNHLQASWKVYGERAFEFEILQSFELDNRQEIRASERSWIQSYRSDNREFGYNLSTLSLDNTCHHSEETRRRMSSMRMGMKFSDAHRAAISESHKGLKRSEEAIRKTADALRGRKRPQSVCEKIREGRRTYRPSEETKRKLSLFNLGKKLSEETKRKIGQWNLGKRTKTYRVTCPSGHTEITRNLREFCAENQLLASGMRNVSCGRASHHKGWKCERIEEDGIG
jgi:group I intron endonuclease